MFINPKYYWKLKKMTNQREQTEKEARERAYNIAQENMASGILDLVGAKLVEGGAYGKNGNNAVYENIYVRGANSEGGKKILAQAHSMSVLRNLQRGGRAYSDSTTSADVVDTAYAVMFGEKGSFYNLKVKDIAKSMGYEGKIDSSIADKHLTDLKGERGEEVQGELIRKFQRYLGDNTASEALALNARSVSRSLEDVLRKPEPARSRRSE